MQNIKPLIAKFITVYSGGVDSLREAGDILVKLIALDSEVFGKITNECPHITVATLRALERIGRKQLCPHLFLDPSEGAKKASRLPYEEQERACELPITVAVMSNGCARKIHKRLRELTKTEADLVFGDGKIRSFDEQKKILDAPASAIPAKPEVRWEFRAGGVFFHRNAFLLREELEAIIRDMPKPVQLQDHMQKQQIARAA